MTTWNPAARSRAQAGILVLVLVLALAAALIACSGGGGQPQTEVPYELKRPLIAMDESGNALLAWLNVRPGSDRGRLFFQGYLQSEGWSGLEVWLSDEGGMLQHQPAMAGDQEYRIAYRRGRTTGEEGQVWPDGSIWRVSGSGTLNTPYHAEIQVAEETTRSPEPHTPQVAVNAAGSDCIVYGRATKILVQQYEGTSNPTALHHPHVELGQGSVYRVAVGPDGTAVVAWISTESGNPGLHVSRSPFTTSETLVDTDDVSDVELALDDSGNGVVAYSKGLEVFSRRYDATLGHWESPVRVNSWDEAATHLDLDVNDRGDAVLVWDRGGRVYGAVLSDPPVVRVISRDAGYAQFPNVTVDREGNALCVWKEDDLIRSSTYTIGDVHWDTPYDEIGRGYEPRLAGNENGDAIAIWLSHDRKSIVRYDFADPDGPEEVDLVVKVLYHGIPQVEALVTVTETTTQTEVCSGYTNELGAVSCPSLPIGQEVRIDVNFADEATGSEVEVLADPDRDGFMIVTVEIYA